MSTRRQRRRAAKRGLSVKPVADQTLCEVLELPCEVPQSEVQRASAPAPTSAPTSRPFAVSARPIALETDATLIPLATLAPAPLPTPAPIPLSTPVPVSPPFAAVSSQAPAAAALAAATAAERAKAPPQAPRQVQNDIFVHEGTHFTGDVLRRAREGRGLTLQALCERTKISRHHIENLEADRYEKLPAAVYLRGFLMAIARELRLDGQKVARSYLDAMAAAPAAPPSSARSR